MTNGKPVIRVERKRLKASRATKAFTRTSTSAVEVTPPVGRDEVLSLEVACAVTAAAMVRAALRDHREFGTASDDVVLVASELVSNAVTHSGGSEVDRLHVGVTLDAGGVRVSVHDPGFSGDHPQLRDAGDPSLGGWGLRIVERLADRWGFDHDDGMRVWADVSLVTPPVDVPAASLRLV